MVFRGGHHFAPNAKHMVVHSRLNRDEQDVTNNQTHDEDLEPSVFDDLAHTPLAALFVQASVEPL